MRIDSRGSVRREMRSIRRSLTAIVRSLQRLGPLLDKVSLGGGTGRVRRRLTLSPARMAALKLQGQYMGHLRRLSVRQKAQVKQLKKARGIRPAIALAKRLGGR